MKCHCLEFLCEAKGKPADLPMDIKKNCGNNSIEYCEVISKQFLMIPGGAKIVSQFSNFE